MLVRLFSLSFLLVHVASHGADDDTRRTIRLETKGGAERHVEIGPHASFASFASAGHKAATSQDSSIEKTEQVKRSRGPTLTGFESNDCGGTRLGSFGLPIGADMTADHCLEVKDPASDLPVGRMKISCEASGVAKACIWHSINDTSCKLSEPFCLNIQAADAIVAARGGCIPVKEHPTEKNSFARFSDFPPDFKWPDCLVPPMPASTLLMVVMGGVLAGLVFLCGLWYCVFALPSQSKQKYMPGKGKGKGFPQPHMTAPPAFGMAPPPGGKSGMLKGKGMMKGKGFPGGK